MAESILSIWYIHGWLISDEEGIFRGFIPVNHHWINDDPYSYYSATSRLSDNHKARKIRQSQFSVFNLEGYQVPKAELFSHTREPAITIWQNRMKFNMACLQKFPGIKYIQVLIHPEQNRLIIRPCESDAPDSLRWATGGGEKELKNRDLMCKIFAGKLYELMD